jgi:Kef-type K+ transport system membrane component KefB
MGVFAGMFSAFMLTTEWIDFLALLGSALVLTFLAGAEIDPHSLKANIRASGLIGLSSFGVAFVVVWLFAQFVFRLAAASGANRRHCAFDHIRGGGLRW